MTEIAIQLEGVSLDYPKQKSGGGLLREVLTGRFKKTRDAAAWHAHSMVNLTVNKGEVVGVMGPNGSGKSTLLRVWQGYMHLMKEPSELEAGSLCLQG